MGHEQKAAWPGLRLGNQMRAANTIEIGTLCLSAQGFLSAGGASGRDAQATQILEVKMENRVAMISIVVENGHEAGDLNGILHEYSEYIIGRMGLPYRNRQIFLISIAIDGPADAISALAGKIGALPGVSAKTVYARLEEK